MTYPTETHDLSTGWDTVFPHHLIGHGGLHHIQNHILSKNARGILKLLGGVVGCVCVMLAMDLFWHGLG